MIWSWLSEDTKRNTNVDIWGASKDTNGNNVDFSNALCLPFAPSVLQKATVSEAAIETIALPIFDSKFEREAEGVIFTIATDGKADGAGRALLKAVFLHRPTKLPNQTGQWPEVTPRLFKMNLVWINKDI